MVSLLTALYYLGKPEKNSSCPNDSPALYDFIRTFYEISESYSAKIETSPFSIK